MTGISLLRIAVSRRQYPIVPRFDKINRRREKVVMPSEPNDAGRHLKITVVLLHKQVAALDHLAVSIRLRTGVALSRASIIDAIIAASMQKQDDVVEQLLQRRMTANQKRPHEKTELSRDRLAKS